MIRWGFDKSFDASASITRRKTLARFALAVCVAAIMGLIADMWVVAAWCSYAIGVEALLALSISPGLMAAHPAIARLLRLVATSFASFGWVMAAAVFLAEGSSSSAAVAVAMLAGICLYVIGACYRTPIHIAAAGLPPTLALLLLPFLLRTSLSELVAMELAMILVVIFGVSSAIAASRSHHRLTLTTSALRKAKQRALAEAAAKSEFLANMSHELRTPLTSVIGFSGLLTASRLPPVEQGYVARIATASEALLSVINDILDYSKLEAMKVDLAQAAFDTRGFIADAVGIIEASCAQRGVALVVNIEEGTPANLLGDSNRLRQVLLNFLSNAAKFTREGGVGVKIGGQPVNDVRWRLRVEVSDTGHGIAPDRLSRLFQRFTQAEASTAREFGGTGLGLAISKKLIEAMGGSIGAESELHVGSTFWFEVDLDVATDAPMSLEPAAPEAWTGLRVLVADDVLPNRELLTALLGAAGLSVSCVSNGVEAVDAVACGTYDLVLMDMHMPLMDGLAATRSIRSSGLATAAVPIIALTANVQRDQIAQCIAAGMNGHVGKPIRISDLMQAISGACAPSDSGQNRIILSA